MVEKLDAFGNKVDLFHEDLLSGRLLHFSTLKTVGHSKGCHWISPGGEFSANVSKVMPVDEAAIQSELMDIQAAGDMKAALRGAESLSAFWVACPREYDTLKTLTMYVLPMFRSTYTCEAAFSKMNSIKTHERNRLSNQSLEDISLTAVKPMSRRSSASTSLEDDIKRSGGAETPCWKYKRKRDVSQ
ncbi:unnamed protein product [Leuciscus chuanchicus]